MAKGLDKKKEAKKPRKSIKEKRAPKERKRKNNLEEIKLLEPSDYFAPHIEVKIFL